MIKRGIGFKQITETIDQLKKKTHLFFVVTTLEYLIKGGRIGRVQGTIEKLLNLKSIISIGDDGKHYPIEMVRGRNRPLERLVSIGKGTLDKVKCKVFVSYGRAEEEQVYKELPKHSNAISTSLGKISLVASVYNGPGLVGIAFLETE
jgi:DegV family protein with EDD domain